MNQQPFRLGTGRDWGVRGGHRGLIHGDVFIFISFQMRSLGAVRSQSIFLRPPMYSSFKDAATRTQGRP